MFFRALSNSPYVMQSSLEIAEMLISVSNNKLFILVFKRFLDLSDKEVI
jgi:hypothetical protein